MKKNRLVSTIALASITAAHACPTVYGKVLLTGEYTKDDYNVDKIPTDPNKKWTIILLPN